MAAGLKVEGMKAFFKGGLLNGAHIAIHTAEPTSSNEFTTADSDGYARQALTLSNWTYSGGVATYSQDIEFDDNTASAWQAASWMALWSAASSGNLLFTVNISDVTPASGRRVYIAANGLTVDMDVANSALTDEGANDGFASGLFSSNVHIGFLNSSDTEITGTSYARTQVTPSGISIDSTTGVASNGANVTSPSAGASDWGDPAGVGIWDSASSGNLLASADFTTDISAPANGQAIQIATGALTFDLGVAA